jgi:hypothetical protein
MAAQGEPRAVVVFVSCIRLLTFVKEDALPLVEGGRRVVFYPL